MMGTVHQLRPPLELDRMKYALSFIEELKRSNQDCLNLFMIAHKYGVENGFNDVEKSDMKRVKDAYEKISEHLAKMGGCKEGQIARQQMSGGVG